MKKLNVLLLGVLMIFSGLVRADEGMWLPLLIKQNMATMTAKGMKLTADDIYNINKSSVKDAIIALDHGSCTGELISAQGLVLTNHHCGYGEIQAHSTVEHDYLTNGFWAMSKDQELPNPGKTASFLIKVIDVTKEILAEVPDTANQAQRNVIIRNTARAMAKTVSDTSHYEAVVENMFYGNDYYLFVYETFLDVRLVAAPPESIGKYGADTDNWMWPRHTGDFSMFRIYCGKDGKPAEYNAENVPVKPKHFLPISLNGVQKDDFAFIMGYPGRTQRYMTSYELKYTLDVANPNRIKIRGEKQDIWKEFMDASDEVRIKYASKFAGSSNYWKYSIGQNKGLKRLKVYDKKVQLENDFTAWVNADGARKAKYGNALNLIKEYFEKTADVQSARQYLIETHLSGSEAFMNALGAMELEKALAADSAEWISTVVEGMKANAAEFFKDYDYFVNLKTTKSLLKMYFNDVPAKYHPGYKAEIDSAYNGNVEAFVDSLFNHSIFVCEKEFNTFLEKPSLEVLVNDPAYKVAGNIREAFMAYGAEMSAYGTHQQEGMRLFVGGLLEMNPNKAYAPDANSTMRLTYGTVGDYKPADAVQYSYFTTMEGIMEKEDPTVREFNVPEKLKEIYNNKDYGRYANADGSMNVCFTTNNDITGGNSGSPVINGEGQLIGLAFDGNWEAMSGDIAFEPALQKTICVDIRYVMLIIDKFAGAQNLIDEMKFVQGKPAKKKKK